MLVAPLISLPSFFHWYDKLLPELAVSNIEVPVHIVKGPVGVTAAVGTALTVDTDTEFDAIVSHEFDTDTL